MKIFFLGILFFLTTNLSAQTVKINIIHARGPYALSEKRAQELIAQVINIYQDQLGIDLFLVNFKTIKNPYSKLKLLSQRQHILSAWKRYFNRKSKSEINLAILPPLQDFNAIWLAGIANQICAINRITPVAYSNAEEFNFENQPRFLHSIFGATHEIGHLLGAQHDSSLPKSIMHPDPLSTIDETGPLKFSNKSKKEIFNCLKDKNDRSN
jgi:hypothetical protein